MRLAELTALTVAPPPPLRVGGRHWNLVELETACGVRGLGEIYCSTFSPPLVRAMAAEVFSRHLEGRDPHDLERAWRAAWSRGYNARPDATLLAVISGLETACWDIVGKAAGRPVCDLLGGRARPRLRAYTYLYPREGEDEAAFAASPERAAEAAAEAAALGFTAVKLDPMGGYSAFDPRQPSLEALDRAFAVFSAVREATGGRVDLLVGTHGQFTAAGALRLARRLEPLDPLWLEEPTPPAAEGELARVAAGTSVPVAAGERLSTRWEFERLIEAGAAVLQPNAGRCGGVAETRRIAAAAEARHRQLAPHCYCGPVVAAANAHVGAASPNLLMVEGLWDWGGFAASILERPLRVEGGELVVPTEPGLGVSLDRAAAEAAAADDSDPLLHLEPAEGPLDGD